MRLTRHVTALLVVCAVIVAACTPAGDKLVREEAPAGPGIVKQTLSPSGGRASTSGWTVAVPSARAGDVLTLKADVALPQRHKDGERRDAWHASGRDRHVWSPARRRYRQVRPRYAAPSRPGRRAGLLGCDGRCLAFRPDKAHHRTGHADRDRAPLQHLGRPVLQPREGRQRTDAPTCTGKVPARVEEAIYFDDKMRPCCGRGT